MTVTLLVFITPLPFPLERSADEDRRERENFEKKLLGL